VRAAADFICAVNAAPRDPQRLAPGSEACFTVAAHVAAVDRRVARLAELDPQAPVRDEAERLVQGRLLPAWRAVQATILREAKALGLDAEAEIPPSEQCISPSDFGFHNALLDGERIGFIDFEYAGRDDPAKLVCDFFCQPEVPVPPAHYEPFVARIVAGLGLDDIHRARCGLLLDAYRIKWICIMLNEFLPADAARRAFADPGARERRCAAQLAKAAASMARVEAA
jgi:hypothetical protein